MAERDGAGMVYYLYHDAVGSTIHVTTQTGNYQASRGYYAYGETRRTGGVMPTDRRYTGQQESATGLYYYGARWYDPSIGQFLSPDTIVPDPTNFLDYNRYLYARGNPLVNNDPSGHIAICFQGGPTSEVDPQGASIQMCNAAFVQGGYIPGRYGDIYYFAAAGSDFNKAYQLAQTASDAGEPVIIAGYSWGASSALALAEKLDVGEMLGVEIDKRTLEARRIYENTHTPVDLLVLIDLEDRFRWIAQPYTQASSPPNKVPNNVRSAVNLWAGNPDSAEWLWANGQNEVKNAVNLEVDLASHYTIIDVNDTRTIMNGKNANKPNTELNSQTLAKFSAAVQATMKSRPSGRK